MFLFLIFIGFLKHKSNTFVEEEEKKRNQNYRSIFIKK